MLLRQLHGFLAIAEERSVSRAAERLFISQPALTARLHALEEELGAPLFVRNARGMRLSEVGTAFLPHAQRAVESVVEGRRVVSRLCAGEEGQLTLAAAPALSTYVLPPLLKRFHDAHPEIHVAVRTGHPEDVVDLVLREEAQIGLACEADHHPELTSIHLADDELVLVAAPDHAVVRRSLKLRDLADEQMIVFRTSSFEGVHRKLLSEAGIAPESVMELDSIDAAKKMVEHGIGIAFLPRVALDPDLADGRLAIQPLRGVPRMPRAIVALRRRDAGPPLGPSAHFLRTAAAIG